MPSASLTRARPGCRNLSSPGPPEPMTAVDHPPRAAGTGGLDPLYAAMRARLALVAVLFVAAALGWVWTAHAMRGMDNGPWSGLGGFAWFLGVWVVMMAAMMLPSVAPTVALYSKMTRSRAPVAPLVFTFGYFLSWAAAGILAFGVADLVGGIAGYRLAGGRAGRWGAAGI